MSTRVPAGNTLSEQTRGNTPWRHWHITRNHKRHDHIMFWICFMLFLKLLLLFACLLFMNQTQGNVMMSPRPMGREIRLLIQIWICKVSELSLFQVKKITHTQGFSFPLVYKGFLLFCHLSSKWEVRGLLDGLWWRHFYMAWAVHQTITLGFHHQRLRFWNWSPLRILLWIAYPRTFKEKKKKKNLSLENSKRRGNV